jgi:hypothetical protein
MMGTIWKIIGTIVGLGVLMAVLTMFGMNPFAVLIWVGKWFYWAVKSVADALLGSQSFRDAMTTRPV